MVFGAKVKDAPSAMLSGGGGEGTERWIKYFQKGETTIHFLEELDEWTVYYEHFHQSKSRAFPCTGDRKSCPGCTSENEKESRASKRYLVNALKDGYVDLYKIPASLWDDLNRFADKDGGTIMARDFTVVRYEKDNGVGYSIDREDKVQVDVRLHRDNMQDHQEALGAAYAQVWGGLPGDNQERAERPAPSRLRSAVVEEENEEDPPSKPEQVTAQEPAQEEEVELTEEQLRAMGQDELVSLYAMCGIDLPADTSMRSLQDHLISALGSN